MLWDTKGFAMKEKEWKIATRTIKHYSQYILEHLPEKEWRSFLESIVKIIDTVIKILRRSIPFKPESGMTYTVGDKYTKGKTTYVLQPNGKWEIENG